MRDVRPNKPQKKKTLIHKKVTRVNILYIFVLILVFIIILILIVQNRMLIDVDCILQFADLKQDVKAL